ncbi:MAG: pyruvate dehydrogenase complex dihydrolipoamide acetyltransferase [Chlamydiales bacterium]|nr:pyruvate dehydrogenase complex dihydrolipoamide acetyltransferase [Chlamydiales bacterium]
MPFTLTMPKLSPTMEEGTIVKWHKKEGDLVQDGDLLFEVATDKATVEHQAIDKGYLRKILIKEGGSAIINQAVAIFTVSKDESIEGYKVEEIVVDKQAEVNKVMPKQETTVEIKKTTTGTSFSQPAFTPPPPLQDYSFEWPSESEEIIASPLAKKIAKEKNLDLSTIKGSGPNGRIVEKDLELASTRGIVTPSSYEAPTKMPGSYHEIALTPMRKTIGERLQASKTFIPHFYVQQEVDAEKLVQLRNELKEASISLTFNDFVVRAVALALRKHPGVNCGFNTVNNTITQYETIDISIAVSIEQGLITPIVRHADYKSISQISKEVKQLASTAKAGKLKGEQYIGGSFTISNLGMYGVRDFQAVINPPQGAILAVGGILDKPVVKNGMVVPGKLMQLSLSVDHRVIDGALAAEFINQVKFLLERPSLLLI